MEGELTPEGLVAFERLDDSEQAIVRWLFTLSPEWPFNGHDIAGMILTGQHRHTAEGE